jgi:hypothetical protein
MKNMVLRIVMIAGLALLIACQKSDTVTLPGSWRELTNFSGVTRSGAVGFVIGNYAYVGTGYNIDVPQRLTDFWRYDPQGDVWTQMADFPGLARSNAAGFSSKGKGYIGTGLGGTDTNNPVPLGDFWQFDPSVGTKGSWTRIADFGTPTASDTALIRYGASGFTVNDRGFVAGGYYQGSLKDIWEYDQPNNQWIQRPPISGSNLYNGFVFVINNGIQDYAYVGGGVSDPTTYATNFYRFDVSQLSGSGSPWLELKPLTGNSSTPTSRELASTFPLNGFGYLICGSRYGVPLADMWRYTPPAVANGVVTSGDTWLQYSSISTAKPTAGPARDDGVGFALGSNGYVATGKSGSTRFRDCWLFNPVPVQ